MKELTKIEKGLIIDEIIKKLDLDTPDYFICHSAYKIINGLTKVDYVEKKFEKELKVIFPELLDMILSVGKKYSKSKFKFGNAWILHPIENSIQVKVDYLKKLKKSL